MSNKTNFLRGLVGVVLGILLIFLALKLKDRIVASKKTPEVKTSKEIKKVIVDTVSNSTVPVEIVEKGNLQALKNVELYSEVQGLLKSGDKLFKPGQVYREGEVILSIDDSEFLSSLKAQRSVMYNQIAQAMPDLRLDYADVYPKWSDYLNAFDVDKLVPVLPELENDREKYFINSKGIITSYYNIKNLEERLKKFRIYAPFYSAVSEALVYPGALVRPGQKLGTIINPTLFEMAVSIDESYRPYVNTGKTVMLRSLDGNKEWKGRIARIDPAINTLTQGITAYVELSGTDLKPGMFLEAVIQATPIANAFELSRKLLIENKSLYIIRGDTLALIPVEIAYFKDKSAVIKNLRDSTVILKNPVPGAYDGMRVEVIRH